MFKKYIFMFFGILLMLFTCSCKTSPSIKEENNSAIPDEIIKIEKKDSADNHYFRYQTVELFVGDSYNPFQVFTSSDIENMKFYVSDTLVLNVSELAYVEAIGIGEARIVVIKDNNYYGTLNYNVTQKEDTLNINYNEGILKELISRLKIIDSSDVTASTKVTYDNDEKETIVKKRIDPFYYESYDEKEKKGEIIKKERDNYFHYKYSKESNSVEKRIQRSFNESNYLKNRYIFDYRQIESEYFNLIEINKPNDNEYIISFNASDYSYFVGEFIKKFVNDSRGYMYSNSICTYDIKFLEGEIDISLVLPLRHVLNGEIYNSNINYNEQIIIDDIEEQDFSNYSFSKPNAFEEIVGETNFSNLHLSGVNYLYGYIEEGFYSIEVEECETFQTKMTSLGCRIYDQELNQIKFDDNLENAYRMKNLIYVPKTDYYYLYISIGTSESETLTFRKLDYLPSAESYELESSEGNLQGKYDYKKFYYYSQNDNELLKITNLSSSKLNLYVVNGICTNYNNIATIYDLNGELYINPGENGCYIYVISPQINDDYNFSGDYPFDYKFKMESIANESGIGDDLDYITSEYGKEYTIGEGLPTKYFLLKVTKKGLYRFYKKNSNGYEQMAYMAVSNDNYYDANFELYLEVGEYLVYDGASSPYLYETNKYRYEYFEINDLDVDIKLNVIGDVNDFYTGIVAINNQKMTDNQVVKYHFTLEEDSFIIYLANQVQIFDCQNTARTFVDYNYVIESGRCIVKLEKGDYYAICLLPPSTSTFKLAIETFETNYYFDINSSELVIKKDYTVEKTGSEYFIKILNYSPSEDVKMTIQNHSFFGVIQVFNENLAGGPIPEYVDSSFVYSLEANKSYYIIIAPRRTIEFSIIIEK